MVFGNGGAKKPVSVTLGPFSKRRAQELKQGRHHGRRLFKIKPSRLHWEQTSARRAKVAGKMQKAESFASRALAAKNARKEKETMRTKEERKAQQMEDAKNAQLCGVGAQTRAKATSKEQAQQKEREMEEKRQLEKNAEQARLQQGKEIEQHTSADGFPPSAHFHSPTVMLRKLLETP